MVFCELLSDSTEAALLENVSPNVIDELSKNLAYLESLVVPFDLSLLGKSAVAMLRNMAKYHNLTKFFDSVTFMEGTRKVYAEDWNDFLRLMIKNGISLQRLCLNVRFYALTLGNNCEQNNETDFLHFLKLINLIIWDAASVSKESVKTVDELYPKIRR